MPPKKKARERNLRPETWTFEHPHSSERLVYCVRGGWVLSSSGRRQLLKPAGLLLLKANEPAGRMVWREVAP